MDDNKDKQMLFLNYAIVDISNYIRFMDAKIAVIMAFAGVMINATLSLRKEVYYVLDNGICPVQSLMYLLLLMVAFSLIIMLLCGFKTIVIRIGSLNYKSHWFFAPYADSLDEEYERYCNAVLNMDNEKIVRDMASELCKLNDIFSRKSSYARKAVLGFIGYVSSSLVILFLIFVMRA